jgi:hypothetical protein
VRRVVIWKADGIAVMFRVENFESFLAELRERAPHAEIRALKSRRSTIIVARKAGFPWLIFTLRRKKFDGLNAPNESVSIS